WKRLRRRQLFLAETIPIASGTQIHTNCCRQVAWNPAKIVGPGFRAPGQSSSGPEVLIQLSIRDIVLIERLDLVFETGLSVLTGETGAGKSILLDSLSLALGGRGDGDLVRHGEDKGQVTAVFDVPGPHPARLFLRENGIDDDGDLIFRRIQNADGRT